MNYRLLSAVERWTITAGTTLVHDGNLSFSAWEDDTHQLVRPVATPTQAAARSPTQ